MGDSEKGYLSTQMLSRQAAVAARRQLARMRLQYGDLLQSLPPGPILEIGPGRGEFLQLALESRIGGAARKVCAVDEDRETVEFLARRYPDIGISFGDALAYMESSNEEYAAVVMLQVLEHMTVEYALALLRQIRARLQLGSGLLLVEVPNCGCSYVGATIHASDITHVTAYTSVSLEQILTAAGYDEIKVTGIRPRGWSPARMLQRLGNALLVNMDRLRHRLLLPSWRFLHEPTMYAVCRVHSTSDS